MTPCLQMTDLHDAFDAHIKAQKEQRSGADGAPLTRRAPAPLPEDALAPITEDDEAAAQKEATIQELQDAKTELQVGTSTSSLQPLVCEATVQELQCAHLEVQAGAWPGLGPAGACSSKTCWRLPDVYRLTQGEATL